MEIPQKFRPNAGLWNIGPHGGHQFFWPEKVWLWVATQVMHKAILLIGFCGSHTDGCKAGEIGTMMQARLHAPRVGIFRQYKPKP